MSPVPRNIDLLWAGRGLMRLLPGPGIRLRPVRGGFRYLSGELALDLTRYGIVLRQASRLPPARQAAILAAVKAIADGLGFQPSGGDAPDAFPTPGDALAIHPVLADLERAIDNVRQARASGAPDPDPDNTPNLES